MNDAGHHPGEGPGPFGRAALAAAGLAGCGAVALGAWAAHGLGGYEGELAETAAAYAMWHALAIIGASLLRERMTPASAPWARPLVTLAILLFGAGIVLFSGGLALSAMGHNPHTAPWGGMAFMAGWIAFAGGAAAAGFSRTKP